MATNEERLAAVEDSLTQTRAVGQTMLGIVQETDRKVDEVIGAVRSIQAQQIVADSRLNTIDNRLNAQRVQTDNIQLDMQRSFAQVYSVVATRQDLEELRTQVIDSFKRILAILDERLPKQGE